MLASWPEGLEDSHFAVVRAIKAWYCAAMARLCRGTDEADEEKPFLMEGYTHHVELYGPQHPETINMLGQIVGYFEKVGDVGRATHWRGVMDGAWMGLLAAELRNVEGEGS
jgi:hypothetical protein